jgi:uncharacterized protein (UPF0548 family)
VPITLHPGSPENLLSRLLDELVTYPEVGATRESRSLPPGYQHDAHSVLIGHGDTAFQRGKDALRHWQAHRHVGATLTPTNPPLAVGAVVVVTFRLGPLYVMAPCRLVYLSDEADRFGFAYGSLPGHPERGEEAFQIRRDADGVVTFDIVVFSRPADLLARIASPVARAVQRRITKGYLEGVREYVAGVKS